MLLFPVVLKSSENAPVAVFKSPLVLAVSASKPMAVLLNPALFRSASPPRNVLLPEQPS